jgi:peptidyl-prolyl cis-trans isomerase C
MKRYIPVFLIIAMAFSFHAYAAESIVARVNGTDLTMSDLENEVDRIIPQMTFHRDLAADKRSKFYPKALEELIIRELQYQEAVAKGIKPDKDQVNAQMEQIRKRFKTKKEFRNYLENKGINEDKLRKRLTRDVIIMSIFKEKVIIPSQISEAELKDYFEKNGQRFKQPETVRLRVISTSDEKKAQGALDKVKAGGDFAEIASNVSEDSFRVKGGDIGYVHKGRMIPEFEETAFKLKPGEVGELIKAEGTWFVLKVEDRKPERLLLFDEIKEKLRQELENRRLRELKDSWFADLKAKAKIEVLLKTEPAEGEGVKMHPPMNRN